MDRSSVLWTIAVFFGASIVFSAIRNATEDEPVGVTLALAVVALGVMIAVISFVVRRRNRP